ncbi:MAG: hypothetical protein MZU95_00090 [Desulfomicrobium escambiense]|nr:hypothetical protein [Desulfomicrobium escambiense]
MITDVFVFAADSSGLAGRAESKVTHRMIVEQCLFLTFVNAYCRKDLMALFIA